MNQREGWREQASGMISTKMIGLAKASMKAKNNERNANKEHGRQEALYQRLWSAYQKQRTTWCEPPVGQRALRYSAAGLSSQPRPRSRADTLRSATPTGARKAARAEWQCIPLHLHQHGRRKSKRSAASKRESSSLHSLLARGIVHK